jgi:ABC-type transport system substrate-binding protein
MTLIERLGSVWRRLIRLPKVLRPKEKRAILFLALVMLGALLWNLISSHGSNPAFGGTYVEGFVGEAKYINPVLASSDADTSMVKLIYSGLTRIDENGDIQPDLASSWEITDGGKTYIFHLRNDVEWHDGSPFTAKDVVYTIGLIQDPAVQSWHFDAWNNISASAPDDYTVKFSLPEVTSTFIWNTTIGIMPAKIGSSDINQSFVGTGPYKYSKVRVKNNKIESIVLVRNTHIYHVSAPYIDAVEIWLFPSLAEAKSALQDQKIQALAKPEVNDSRANSYQLILNQKITLFINSQSALLSDLNVRQQLLSGTVTASITKPLVVVVDTAHANDSVITETIKQWEKEGITITSQNLSLTAIKASILPSRKYDVLILAVEDGPQFDYYAYWHSSQMSGLGLNFSSVKNNDLDKLLSDQRKALTIADRSTLTDQIEKMLDGLAVRKVLSQAKFEYAISKNVHVVPTKVGNSGADRFNSFEKWYIKTRR